MARARAHAVACPSPNHGPRRRRARVELLVLHYTGMRSGAEAVARLREPAAEVSAHYVVEEDGTILALVPEARRAWHAGASSWQGRGDVNSRSIGIEIVNPGHDWGYRPFPAAQVRAAIALGGAVVARWRIPPAGVLGHSDVAPLRKVDPGELFPWERLARAGIGVWPRARRCKGTVSPAAARRLLRAIGYGDLGAMRAPADAPLRAVLRAFQRHWRPRRIDGILDGGTWAMLQAVGASCAHASRVARAPAGRRA